MNDIENSMRVYVAQWSNRIHDRLNALNIQWSCKCFLGIIFAHDAWGNAVFYVYFLLNFSFPIATAAIYVRRFFDGKSRQTAVDIAMNIHKQFIETLKQVPWMDEKSRASAIEKANSMQFHIGYPDALMNDTLIDDYYKDLELETGSFLHSMFHIRKFLRDREIMKLRQPVNKNDWIEQRLRTTSVNAAYLIQENSIRTLRYLILNGMFSPILTSQSIIFRFFSCHSTRSIFFGWSVSKSKIWFRLIDTCIVWFFCMLLTLAIFTHCRIENSVQHTWTMVQLALSLDMKLRTVFKTNFVHGFTNR